MTPLHQQLVGQLRAAYYDSGLTYEQIAERTSMSTKTVQRALNGRQINTITLFRLCAVFKRQIHVLPL